MKLSQLAVLKIYVCLYAFVYLVTEILSLFNLINFTSIFLCWSMVVLVGILLLIKKKVSYKIPKFSAELYLISFILFILLFLCIYVPPNNYDSMSYHMPRVIRWMQNGNVNYYPTNILRQLYYNPLAEYLILHLQILTFGDYFANSVQYLSLIISLITLIEISKLFEPTQVNRTLIVAIALANPMLIFQSTSTQNDLVAASFFLLSFLFAFQYFEKNNKSSGVWLVVALALGGLVKFTVWILIAPIIAYFLVRNIKKSMALLPFLIPTLMAVFSPFFYRNFKLFGHILGPTGNHKYNIQVTNSYVTIKGMCSNFIRNLANNISLPFESWNKGLYQQILNLHQYLGININEEAYTYSNFNFVADFGFTEDNIGNHVGLFLFVFSIIIGIYQKTERSKLFYFILFSFLLFCLVLKYQPMHQRLLLPLSLLSTIYISNAIPQKTAKWVSYFCLIYSLVFVFINKSKPIIVVENIAREILSKPKSTIQIKENKMDDLEISYLLKYYDYYGANQLKIKDLTPLERSSLVEHFNEKPLLLREKSIWESSREELYFKNKTQLFYKFKQIQLDFKKNNCSSLALNLDFDGMEYPFHILFKNTPIPPFSSLPLFNDQHITCDCVVSSNVDSETYQLARLEDTK